MLIRWLNRILIPLLFRVTTINARVVPKTGGALLVCNHASYADPSLVSASLKRPVRFLVMRSVYNKPILGPIVKSVDAIPVSKEDSPKEILKSLQKAREAVRAGEVVCVFAEGGLTRIGRLLPFRKGFEFIMRRLKAPIIPVHIDRVWGSIFGFKDGKVFWKMPEELPYPVTVSFGKPMPASSKAPEVRAAVQELSSESFRYRKEAHKLLHVGFLHQAKHRPLRRCVADTTGRNLNYLQTLAASLGLAKRLGRRCEGQKMVGVLLPSSVAAVLANLSLMIAGRVPVNLNFTVSGRDLIDAKRKCGIRTVITSRRFIEKIRMPKLPDMVFLEDIADEISQPERVYWTILSLLAITDA